ncbi:membrane bound O-acyl transferase family-domain-containing protein [Blastopirellula sp. JC732]|uniref:Membrane bound O-acyl transferase family-domain-containing protein n=1 Tax=Blastopirellula sediminis TaxID=2894196 RepID=A0A9X1MH00_9BACT|nr:membrane bound O-acyl transferase family-domain-containing protein [Blastopirellula sediminis]MCC9626913.1 membrane bound O-acyl transferase family-domain-containing protein [Blastopirellula sediminis]
MSLLGMATGLAELPNKLAVGWLGMVGMILLLHFGLFHLLSCWWRSRGVDAPPLMNAPLLARSVSEFWGRRWNGAFRDLTHRFLFRTLAVRIGAAWAVMIGFLFSGLVHDMVISYPAGGGYGWPTAYFLLQGSAILLERSWLGKRASLHRGWQGRAFAAVVLVAPIAWLFHHWFVENIIVPMLLVWKEIG